MKGHATLMSKASDEWATPQAFFDWANARYGPFDLDAAATWENAKCAYYLGDGVDALLQPWPRCYVWLNPPYSRIDAFMDKAVSAVATGWPLRVVCLVPARTDTKWWHRTVPHCSKVLLLKGRLKFGAGAASAPFPSALLVIKHHDGAPVIQNCDWRHA